MISQSDKIFGAILIAFLIYITVRGQLGSYANLFVGEPQTSTSSSSSSGGIGGFFNNLFGNIFNGFTTAVNPSNIFADFLGG